MQPAKEKFPAAVMNESGFELLDSEDPKPTPPEKFPTFPAKSEQHRAPPPNVDNSHKKTEIINPERAKLLADLKVRPDQVTPGAFSLEFDKTRF
ncbi:hypothetical protein KIN20_003552 [Parelaphostrongylus tenuis]|uniref:Uncharacterized protein n=1 Tax=Parelaphostrongylus tenuis TaxID=148309 RepID=A0AAD5LWX9_PARTN|nr:hypothetical protein KIN20_003552 [Parelaphostrongylus tenuis]